MDLFEHERQQELDKQAPLALRMRPRTLDEFVGQEQIIGPGSTLRRAVEGDRISSLILYGPPGSGKTALARIIASYTRSHFEQINAVTAGVADIRRVMDEARRRRESGVRTILFIDEIHRFNRAQQDALLPAVEDGTLVLIGATTENPFVSVTGALVSRCRVYGLRALTDDEVRVIVERALVDPVRGLGGQNIICDEDALQHIVRVAGGDARAALNGLEAAAMSAEPGPDGRRHITLRAAEDAMQRKALLYDQAGDEHYDTASAFIKSIRGSDPDAAVFWLARMIYGGEDPRFIARRLIISAAEDIGLADPMALPVAVAAAQAVEMVGLPEARIPLAEATIYLAMAPKSNSAYLAIDKALEDVAKKNTGAVPPHLRGTGYRGAERLGSGRGYVYPHDFPGHYVVQQYLPDEMLGTQYYTPGNLGREARLAEFHRQITRRE